MIALGTLRQRLTGLRHQIGQRPGAPVALSLPLLVAALGVGAETAVVLELQWRAQIAADAAAIAAADRLARGETGKVVAAAQRAAQRIGRAGSAGTPVVTVRRVAGADTAVEVTVERQYVPLVARFFVTSGAPVTARATAQVVTDDGDCVVSLVRASAKVRPGETGGACDGGSTMQAVALPLPAGGRK